MEKNELNFLRSPDGLELVKKFENEDPAGLALKLAGTKSIPVSAVAGQVKCRQKARNKLPSLSGKDLLYTQEALEQSSGEEAAKYKSVFMRGARVIDITGGLGIDTFYLSGGFRESVYVEKQQILSDIAAYNFRLLGADNISVKNGDGIEILKEYPDNYFDWLYADPSRRRGEQRSVDIAYLEPDIPGNILLMEKKARNICIKLSPAFDLTEAIRTFPGITSFRVVSVNGENKEALVIIAEDNRFFTKEAVLLERGSEPEVFSAPANHSISLPETSKPYDYFFEAGPAVIRAELTGYSGDKFGLRQLSPNGILMTGKEPAPGFPGREFKTINFFKYKPAGIKSYLKSKGVSKANITTRDFPENVAALRKRYKLKEGGKDYLFFYCGIDGAYNFIHGIKP